MLVTTNSLDPHTHQPSNLRSDGCLIVSVVNQGPVGLSWIKLTSSVIHALKWVQLTLQVVRHLIHQ
jgi:hypothetical protein